MTIGVPFSGAMWAQLPEDFNQPGAAKKYKQSIQDIYKQLDAIRGTTSGKSEYLNSRTNGTLGAANGGTGMSGGTPGGVVYFKSATTMSSSSVLSQNDIVIGGGPGGAPSTIAHPGTANQYALTGTTGSGSPIWTIATSSATTGTYALRDSAGGLAMTSLTATTLTATFATFSGTVIMGSGLTVADAATMSAVGMATLTATAATFTGAINAQGATFANVVVSGASTLSAVAMATLTATAATFTGAINAQGATFTAVQMATLTATAATFTGAVNAQGATFTSIQVTTLTAAAVTVSGAANFGLYQQFAGTTVPTTPNTGFVKVYALTANGVTRLVQTSEAGFQLVFFRDEVQRVRNNAGVTLTAGTVAYVTGTTGTVPQVGKAKADAVATSAVLGVIKTASIADNTFGTVQLRGIVDSLDTSAWLAGDTLYLSAATAGALTNVAPTSPNLQIQVGTVITSHATTGQIYLNIVPFHSAVSTLQLPIITKALGGTGEDNSTGGVANTFWARPNGATGTASYRAIVAADIPTLNQDTTGSAAKWTTARSLAGNSVDGSANVAFANKFVVQGTADAGLSAAQFLGALGTGIVKNTTTTGVLSIAVAGDFPTLNQNTTGSAATLTTPRAINGTNFDGSAAITVPVNNADDTTTAATVYPLWTATAGGNYAAKVSSTKLTFNPSTGLLTATGFSGSAANLTSFPTLNQNTTGTSGGLTGTPDVYGGTLRASTYTAPASGAGLELGYTTGSGYIAAYDRTGSVFKDLSIRAQVFEITTAGIQRIAIDASGNVSTNGNPLSSGAFTSSGVVKGVSFEQTTAANAVSPTSPNRTITVVCNGVTLYIPAKTTND